ncbi:hypothetical protein RF11_03758 [Thelohanellus kitauei]|uniref:Serpin domain-containing protein n=1 Tax=Thelohanellus kitauei TaxID=669202 RepID=A0A0C2N2Q8_THEKT|nr:hypothetical protein RF11_03758 [Thelohanellus kitauei]
MADRINDFTIKLANYLFMLNEGRFTVSFSGLIAYLSLSLLTIGLHGPVKDSLLDCLNCNISSSEISQTRNILEDQCLNTFHMNEFLKIGSYKSAIFHSKKPLESFKQMALEKYDTELKTFDGISNDLQLLKLNEWVRTLSDGPFPNIFIHPFKQELSLLIINDYLVQFQWRAGTKQRYNTKTIFTDIKGKSAKVVTMRIIEYVKYLNDPLMKAEMVFIPLQEENIFASIVLPYNDSNIKDLLQSMNVYLL